MLNRPARLVGGSLSFNIGLAVVKMVVRLTLLFGSLYLNGIHMLKWEDGYSVSCVIVLLCRVSPGCIKTVIGARS